MIIRSRRKNETFLDRMIGRFRRKSNARYGILSNEQFLVEIAKETSRANRRETNRELAIVVIDFSADEISNDLVVDFRRRLRISDSIGWFQDRFAVLLPETDREGAMTLTNELAKLGLVHDVRMDTEILVYPWDDELASIAKELAGGEGTQPTKESEVGPGEGSDSGPDSEEATDVHQCHVTSDLARMTSAFSKAPPTPIWKRTIDICGAGFGLILLSPVFLLAAIAIKLNSRGPVFFKQLREGIDGEQFEIWKFRTMQFDAESQKDSLRSQSEQDGPAFKIENDPRITTVGRYLRKSCVDELPQLINILFGQMSLVGPRPLPVNESVACRSWQRHRLKVLPGLTCIWQVDGGRDTKFDQWMRMDLEYIRKRSLFFDLKLIFRTIFVALLHRGSV